MNPQPAAQPAVSTWAAAAIEVARAGLVGLAPDDAVGVHQEVVAEDADVATHLFDCLLPGYVGWRWAVTVVRSVADDLVTVDEAVLLPGPAALLAPAWVPWRERLQPGDVGVGDLLPTPSDDARLEPGWNGEELDDDDVVIFAERDDALDWAQLVAALDLTRARVLSPLGFDDAFDRWEAGDTGPQSPSAQAAPAPCASCGFRVALPGSLGHAWGICANVYSPSDGRVVSLQHGCGAHSEVVLEVLPTTAGDHVIDELGYELVEPTLD